MQIATNEGKDDYDERANLGTLMKCRNSILLSYYEFIIISSSSVVPCIIFFQAIYCNFYVWYAPGYERRIPCIAFKRTTCFFLVFLAALVGYLSIYPFRVFVLSFIQLIMVIGIQLIFQVFWWLFEDSFRYVDCGISKSEWLTDVN